MNSKTVRYADQTQGVANPAAKREEWNKVLRGAARMAIKPTRANLALWAISFSALAAFLAMTTILSDARVYGWEADVTRTFQEISYPQWAFDLTANRLTNSDTPEGAAIILTVVGVLWVLKHRIESLMVLLISLPLHAAANLPKLIVEREGQNDAIDGIIGGGAINSFPSGHSEFAITFYGFLLYVACIYVRNPVLRGAAVGAWILLVLAVGYARIEAGEHWPLDVIGGYIVGVGILSALIWVHRALVRERQRPSI